MHRGCGIAVCSVFSWTHSALNGIGVCETDYFHRRLSDFVSLKTGFIVSAYRLVNITLLTLVQQATLWFQGESPTYILNEDTHPIIRAIGVAHTASEDEFDEFFELTGGVHF